MKSSCPKLRLSICLDGLRRNPLAVQTAWTVSRSRLERGNHGSEKSNLFFLANLSEENVKCVFTRDEIAYTGNAKSRVKNTLHLKTHLDAVFRPYIRAISAHYCSQNTLEYSKALRGNCVTMRDKIF